MSRAGDDRFRRDLILKECCRRREDSDSASGQLRSSSTTSTTSRGPVLELCLGVWCDHIDEKFLIQATRGYKAIALKLEHAPALSPEICSWISKHVSPKLVEITVIDCTELTWNGYLKKMLEPATFIEVINLQRNSWVDDYVVEQLGIKFAKSLRDVNLEKSKITDTALHHLCKCINLRTLGLTCCPKVSDTGIGELAKKVHLSNLHLSHNVLVTDSSMESLLSSASSLKSLHLNNCPMLTDRTISALYERIVAWGKRRNVKAQTIWELELRDNPNFTSQSLVWISTAMPTLARLDLRDCVNIDLGKGVLELQTLTTLEHLYLGPSDQNLDADQFVEGMLFHSANLKTLHLVGLSRLGDEDVAEILEGTLVLEEILLSDIGFTSRTIEALCSNVPNIKRASFIGSSKFLDMDLRCFTGTCTFLRELTVQRCPGLTDAAFSKCTALKRLSKLDIAHISDLCNGTLLGSFTLCPLSILNLDGLNFHPREHCPSLSPLNVNSLREVSMRDCPKMDVHDVSYMLVNFAKCFSLDLYGSGGGGMMGTSTLFKDIEDPQQFTNYHPLLKFINEGESFCGFKMLPKERNKHAQIWSVMLLIRMHKAAKKMQKLRRKYLEGIQEALRAKEAQAARRRLYLIVKTQSVFRQQKARREILPYLLAGRRIVRGARRFLNFRFHRKIVKAKTFYNLKLERNIFDVLVSYAKESKKQVNAKYLKVVPRVEKRLRKHYFNIIKVTEQLIKDHRLYQGSRVVWEQRILRKIVMKWKTLRGETQARRLQLMKIWNNVVSVDAMNSFRQKAQVNRSKHFHLHRILFPAWAAIADDFVRSRLAKAKEPMADAYFAKTFWERVVRNTYGALKYFWESKKIKRVSRAKSATYLQRKQLLQWFHIRHSFHTIRSNWRRYKKIADYGFAQYYFKMALRTRFPQNNRFTKYASVVRTHVYLHWRAFKIREGMQMLANGTLRLKALRGLNIKADKHKFKHYAGMTYNAWKNFKVMNADIEKYYTRWYLLKVCKKCIGAMSIAVMEKKRYLAQLQEDLAKTLKLEEEAKEGAAAAAEAGKKALILLTNRIILFQKRARGMIARIKYEKRKLEVAFAIQVMQKFIRMGLARLQLKVLKKKFLAKERAHEYQENDAMYKAEKEMEYFMYHFKAAANIQRVFRGWKGRLRGVELAKDIINLRSKGFYGAMREIRATLEKQRKLAEARAAKKAKSAVVIQKRVRGLLARAYFVKLKTSAMLGYYVVYIQKNYRRKLALLKLNALRRDMAKVLKFRRVRRQRGFLMRLMGTFHRKQQKALGFALFLLGLDPFSFNYRLDELVEEAYTDFTKLVSILRREYNLYMERGYNPMLRAKGRLEALEADGWTLKPFDSIKIIDEENPFFGHTGIVVRIDTSVPGTPLFEIKLDAFPRQTFLRMTVNAIAAYEDPQPLAKIDRSPPLIGFEQPFIVYGTNPDDPFFQRRNVTKAWVIQRAWRMHRARKIVARRRYEFWVRSTEMQWSLFNHMADTNTLTTQGNNLFKVLGFRPKKPVFFDEVRHPIIPGRYAAYAGKMDEKVALNQEMDEKWKARLQYLEKCAIIPGKEYFSTGYEKFTRYRKLGFLFRTLCGFGRGKKAPPGGPSGVNAARALGGSSSSIVTGLDQYYFKQMVGSPHVRYCKKFLYQGEWSGIPFITPLRPHGEGLLMFMDGWGFSEESKVLYLTIIKCAHLNASDGGDASEGGTSDPYCIIKCNGTTLFSTVKWETLNPVYYEKFEIDVSNPNAKLNITVNDKDYIGNDDFLGQLELQLSKYDNGIEVEETHLLKGEDLSDKNDDADYGEITIRIRWSNRKFEDDMMLIERQNIKIVRLQAWARRIAATTKVRQLRKAREDLMTMARQKATMITNICRMRLASRELIRLRKRKRAAIRIQKRIRIFIAKRVFKRKKLRYYAAVDIQKIMRGYLGRALRARMVKANRAGLDHGATVIQKHARRYIVMKSEKARKEALKLLDAEKEEADEEEEDTGPNIAAWFGTYGRDPEYGLKRNRRLTMRIFSKMLKREYVRLVSPKFGILYVRNGGDTPPDGMISVYLPTFKPNNMMNKYPHRAYAIEQFSKFPHTAQIHLESCIDLRKSVEFAVITVQCRVRQRAAEKEKEKILKIHRAIAKFQNIFRRRNERLQRASYMIVAVFRLVFATKKVALKRKERKAAITIQCAYRSHRARRKEFDLRTVQLINILKCSSFVPLHEPEKCLEYRSSSFWLADSPEFAELRLELKKPECITEIWIMSSCHAASPKLVAISAVTDKLSQKFDYIVRSELLPLKGERWHIFKIPQTITKYFRITFRDNYGDEEHIGIRQIRFLRAREISATITKQPINHIIEDGPVLGTSRYVVLSCDAIGWPRPTFQWYRGKKMIKGATSKTLALTLKCELSPKKRVYRCVRCKMVCQTVSSNVYHTRCGNCNYLFAFKEIEEYDLTIKGLREDKAMLEKEISKMEETLVQVGDDPKYEGTVRAVKIRLAETNKALASVREAFYSAKTDLSITNRYSDEGIYTCRVTNIRGGSIITTRTTERTVVVVEHSVPYLLRVRPEYFPRVQEVRKKWTSYSSIQGNFKKGRLEGLVIIRYDDGSFYEGPYVSEEFINRKGKVLEDPRPKTKGLVGHYGSARAKDHYGIYKNAIDGRTYEGSQVDNHFDPNNLQSFYRVTMANGEVYEGLFCDETFHGVGMYTYKDGSVYEGQWHRGSRFGHGHLRCPSEGWTYEGFFDTNRRHGEGVITWDNGAVYMGEWNYNKIQGNGIFISHLRDVYEGQMKDGMYHGHGRLLYANGAVYTGEFVAGLRHGKGIFSALNGCEYFGHYIDDELHGEVIVKQIIPLQEKGQKNYDIRVAIYENGTFVKYKVKASNTVATKQFIAMFRDNRMMYDSIYSMILAKNLPKLPDGVDPTNDEVLDIVFKLRAEAGMLVGTAAAAAAAERVEAMMQPIKDKKAEIERIKLDIEQMGVKVIHLTEEMALLEKNFKNMFLSAEREQMKAEQFWMDEPTASRYKFMEACENLKKAGKDDYFAFRNHRKPPPFVRRILEALAHILGNSTEWKEMIKVISDSVYNGRNGEEDALRFEYTCKLIHLTKKENFKVFDYVKIQERSTAAQAALDVIFADPRFRPDSYYVESCGVAAPYIVDWIKKARAYILLAKSVKSSIGAYEEKKTNAFRLKAIWTKKGDELKLTNERIEMQKRAMVRAKEELEEANLALLKGQDLLKFLTSGSDTRKAAPILDYYEQLEKKMDEMRDKFELEATIELLLRGVEGRFEAERQAKIRDCLAKQIEYEEPKVEKQLIKDWLMSEIKDQQKKLIESGISGLGFSAYKPEVAEKMRESGGILSVDPAELKKIIDICVDLTIGNMNERYNDLVITKEWTTVSGKKFNSRFLYVLAWKMWEAEAVEMEEVKAIEAWESAFPSSGGKKKKKGGEAQEAVATTAEGATSPAGAAVEVSSVAPGGESTEAAQTAASAAAASPTPKEAQSSTSPTPKDAQAPAEAPTETTAGVPAEVPPEATQEAEEEEEEEEEEEDHLERAIKAWEAEVNQRMSAVAREQGRIWAKRHPKEMDMAKGVLAGMFVESYPSPDGDEIFLETAKAALYIIEDETDAYPPPIKAQCLCWIKLNPDVMVMARDEKNMLLAEEFSNAFSDAPGENAFRILNGFANKEEDYNWHEYAGHWRSFFSEEYQKAANAFIESRAAEFVSEHPETSPKQLAIEAAKLIDNDAVSRFILDEEVYAEYAVHPDVLFNAKCWGFKNQGLLRGGTQYVKHENEQRFIRGWSELYDMTDKFRKGSYQFTTPAARKDPSQDRFFGYRAKLENKFAWVYGQLCRTQEEVLKELEQMEINDPFGKVFHNIRPSQAAKLLDTQEKSYLKDRKKAQARLADTLSKLAQWNTYFGKTGGDVDSAVAPASEEGQEGELKQGDMSVEMED